MCLTPPSSDAVAQSFMTEQTCGTKTKAAALLYNETGFHHVAVLLMIGVGGGLT